MTYHLYRVPRTRTEAWRSPATPQKRKPLGPAYFPPPLCQRPKLPPTPEDPWPVGCVPRTETDAWRSPATPQKWKPLARDYLSPMTYHLYRVPRTETDAWRSPTPPRKRNPLGHDFLSPMIYNLISRPTYRNPIMALLDAPTSFAWFHCRPTPKRTNSNTKHGFYSQLTERGKFFRTSHASKKKIGRSLKGKREGATPSNTGREEWAHR
ncbi:hypothetical protein MSL71_5980 [Desulfoluna butyratoxydans]|uniref:Uncharacterized protein n=1 Tax=Desulfoluna butyratoxydans TaxID=231438 RepID=A0A4U8YHE2_9BACT|nr:hypothetical protein MSL71_5980 [Desulfoluna butyratoxydans]